MNGIVKASLFIIALLFAPAIDSVAQTAAAPTTDERTVPANAALVREVQFMLLSLGIDPGPIDGTARQLTNHAVHIFQQRSGLPVTDIVNDRPLSSALVDRLRKETAQTLLRGAAPEREPPPQAAVARPPEPRPAEPPPPPAPAVAPAPVPDRFASCPFKAADFHVGELQFTPQSFLDEGFGGVTNRAVLNLRQRLDEARQIADRIGGPALAEVQRQAHVLAYFECRQKIEQSEAKN